MASKAILKQARISPQKLRLVADQVRGKPVGSAIDLMRYSNKKAALFVRKVIESAIANAEHNEGVDVDDLSVVAIEVSNATVMKRLKPRARGRADRILKRSSHITVVVGDKRSYKQQGSSSARDSGGSI